MTKTQTEQLTPATTANDHPTPRRSSIEQKIPRLTHRGLTTLLVLMCTAPVVLILLLWLFLPRVAEGQLKAKFTVTGIPADSFYEIDYYDRPEFDGGVLTVENLGDEPWAPPINVQINSHYQIYDTEPVPPKSTRSYQLNRFFNRTGALYNVRYTPLKNARIYARTPTNGRATHYQDFLSSAK